FASDGPVGLDLVRRRRPDVVLLDLGLPTMGGFDVLAGIKALVPDVPVIVVTVTTETRAVVQAMKLGAFDYVTKPFRHEELLDRVHEALTRGGASARVRIRTTPDAAGRPDRRCLVVVGHVGTAGTLKLILQRHVTTQVATDGISAVRVLGASVPDCVVCDKR